MICQACNETIPDISRYCLHCGILLHQAEKRDEGDTIDWDNRVLCSDGSCTGTIEEGRCTVCGKPLSDRENN